MTYREYIRTAYKHLYSCEKLLDAYLSDTKNVSNTDLSVLLELYYLTGYIMEGFTVYLVYKKGGWVPNVDIQHSPDPAFTARTHVDFYPNRITPKPRYSIKSHDFQSIIKNLCNNDPAYDILPYFGNVIPVDSDVRDLLDKWKPGVRYCHVGQVTQLLPSLPNLTSDVMLRLIRTCKEIFQKIPYVA